MSKLVRAIAGKWILVGLMVGLLSCGGELELQEPPSVDRLRQQFEAPNALVNEQTVEVFLDRFDELREQLRSVDDLSVLTDPIREFADAVEVSPDGTVTIDGAPLRTDAQITVTARCRGWGGGETGGEMTLDLVVQQSVLVPIGWGRLHDCRDVTTRTGRRIQFRMSGEILVYLPNLVEHSSDEEQILISLDFDVLQVNDTDLAPWSGAFRLTDEAMEVSVTDRQGRSLVVFMVREPQEFGLRAANGTWSCFPDERRCERRDRAGDGFAY